MYNIEEGRRLDNGYYGWGRTGTRRPDLRCSHCGASGFRYNNGNEWSLDGVRGYRCLSCGTVKPESSEPELVAVVDYHGRGHGTVLALFDDFTAANRWAETDRDGCYSENIRYWRVPPTTTTGDTVCLEGP